MFSKPVSVSLAAVFALACGRESKPSPSAKDSTPASAASAGAASAGVASAGAASSTSAPSLTLPPPNSPTPTRLTTLPGSAYSATLAIDDEAVYLMMSNAVYRLVQGEPMHGIQLELGIGPVLTRSAFVFWSNGTIWSAPKQGGVPRELAQVRHQPQYFVASGEAFAWVDQSDEGVYSIQTLDNRKPRILFSSPGEIRSLDMIGDLVYFIERPTDDSWRIGFVGLEGHAKGFGSTRKGRAPSQLAGTDGLYYFDLDRTLISKAFLDLRGEEIQYKDLVCSPVQVSTRIYCGCVEGLFEVSKDTHQPKVLVYNRPGTITNVVSNAKAVAWISDIGRDQLAVDLLPSADANRPEPVP